MQGLRFGKVIAVYFDGTIDVLLINGGGILYNVMVLGQSASTTAQMAELPVLRTVNNTAKNKFIPANFSSSSSSGASVPVPHLFEFENNLNTGRPDLEEDTSNYCYACVGMMDFNVGKLQPVCLGFRVPARNQTVFNPSLPAPTNANSVAAAELPKLEGAYMHRTNSDVYTYTDIDGNSEWFHPNGSFIRIAETPTDETDGAVHVDWSGANANAQSPEKDNNGKVIGYNGASLTTAWNTSKKKGTDGKLNSERQVYFHMEIITGSGTVMFDVDKITGNVTIQSPGDSPSKNKVLVKGGGDVTVESQAGKVNIKSDDSDVDVSAIGNVDVSAIGNVNISAVGSVNITSLGNVILNTAGDVVLSAGGGLVLDAAGDAAGTIQGTANLSAGGFNFTGSIDSADNVAVETAASGTFTTADGQVVMVQDGIVISIE